MRSPNTVELIDYVGGDKAHALAAWASTGTELNAETEKRIPQLLHKLASNGHGTPFEHSLLSFRVQSDLATHIHILKHRSGVSVNAESARYKELKRDSYYIPDDWPQEIQECAEIAVQGQQELYHLIVTALTDRGVARSRAKESARFLLPYSNQIRYVVTFNFRSFIHFQKLRNAPEAQREVREVALKMLEQVRTIEDFHYSLQVHGF